MRHGFKFRRILGTLKNRKRTLRTMADLLVTHERMVTTRARAGELQNQALKLIRVAKKPKDRASNLLIYMLRTRYACNKAIEVLAPRYKNPKREVIRVTDLGRRKSDSARLARIEFVGNEAEIRERKEEEKEREKLGKPSFWEFSKNIAKDELIYCKKALKAVKAKRKEAMLPENQDKMYGHLNSKDYIKNCEMAITRIKEKMERANKDIEILYEEKKSSMFRNCDIRYSTPLIHRPSII